MKRRELLKRATALGALVGPSFALAQAARAAPAPNAPAAKPASDRLRVGMIGVGNFGTVNLRDFSSNPDVQIAAVCDVNGQAIDKAVAFTGGKAKPYRDYRKLLEDRSIDAVVISTPEHWHAIMGIDACEAGKDVYVEKPASHNIRDGRLMVDAARRHNRIVQVGTQQRSGTHFQRAVKHVREGKLGNVHYVTCWTHFPRRTPPPVVTGGPPPDFDWEMWLGPAPKISYADVMSGDRRTKWSLWGGLLTEWGAHLADIVLWAMNVGGPESVVAAGARFAKQGRPNELPDTLSVSYNYPGFLFHYSILQHNTYGPNGDPGADRWGSYGIQFQGDKGTLFVDRNGYKITPQPVRVEPPGPAPGQRPAPPRSGDARQTGVYYTTALEAEIGESSEQHGPHVRNFIDCVKSRKRPNSDIETGHHANTVCRLGNIAYRVGRRIRWDPAREQIIDDPEAQRLVIGTYRDPWKPKGI